MKHQIQQIAWGVGLAIGALGAASVESAKAQPAPGGKPAIVSHVKLVSDKVEDVSSLDAWKRSFLRPGMTDREKALAVWETVVKFRHQDVPPNEFLQESSHPHDPIKTFNVYGYGQCCCASSNVEALGRYAGLEARGRILRAHSVPELFWDGGWRMLDGSLLTYFPKADGTPAGVDEIMSGIKEWYAKNPGYAGSDEKLRAYMRAGGWRKGPEILSRCPFYDENGWLPAATHGWYATMQEYDGSQTGIYEYGYSQGYEVNVQLREGERLTRNWSNRGLQVNGAEGGAPGCLKGASGSGDLRYAPDHGDLAPGRIGNGTLVYDVPLASGAFRSAALQAENLACRADGLLASAAAVKDPSQPATLVLRVPSSYVYLDGEMSGRAVVPAGGEIEVQFSDNNGLDWRPVSRLTAAGPFKVDLKPLIYRRYDYRLKLVLKGKGTGLDQLRLLHTVQHSQRALPALGQGDNTLTFDAGDQEGTVTLEASLDPARKGKQVVYTDYHPALEGVGGAPLRVNGAQGTLTFPVTTPGDLTRLRFGGHYRARDARDGWDLQVSFNGGKTFRTAGRLEGPTAGNSRYVSFTDVPPGTRSALVRYAGSQRNTTCLFDFRIDADYREPRGGFRPVKVTYVWTEAGVEKQDVHVARQPAEKYHIRCANVPVMKSFTVELAD